MGTLFECLREARLEKYYPSFRAHGITRSENLTRLTVQDCSSFGINSAEDKRRLVELINIVKAVHNTDTYQSGSSSTRSSQQGRKTVPRKRNRSPAPSAFQVTGRGLSATNDVRVRDNRTRPNASSHHLSQIGAAVLDLLSDDSSASESSGSTEHSDYEPAVKHSVSASVSARASPPRIRKTPVEKVKHGKGYNYGVPGGSSSTAARLKGRGSGRPGEEKIRVCVRKRPLSRKEIKSGEEDLSKVVSTTTMAIREPKQAVDLTAYTLEHEFIFDEVFDEKCSNEDVYIRAARPLISCVFDGGSATCFAYGQTGAGKTHTMIGDREIPGMYLLAAHDIFSIVESGQYGTDIKVWVSFFEIYCGQLFDLLNRRNRLHAREDGSHRVCLAGLTETEVKTETSLMQVLEYGNAVRSKGSTGVNPDSSRSHAVLQLEIRDRQDKRFGRISFIDLAGSERASDVTDTDKQTRMEGAEINQSLLALKECIRSIDQESRHTPFRQSKLTHILKDSFIGNSRTCMIANISPAKSSCEHTLNTLRYADRVKELRRTAGSATSRSVNVAMSNILMNIPASAPSLFQPSNILCSSTPMRPNHKQNQNKNGSSDITFDPSETPLRGPGAKRKTASASKQSSSQRSSVSASVSVASRSPVVRHVALRQNDSSHSESDQTDTDSCNVTGPQNRLMAAAQSNNIPSRAPSKVSVSQNIPVVKSTDTDNDFPTTDFNNEEEMNDLNRTGGKNPPVVAASVPAFPTGISRPTATQNAPQGPVSVPQAQASSVSASSPMPILRQKVYSDKPSSQNTEESGSAGRQMNDMNSGSAGRVAAVSRGNKAEVPARNNMGRDTKFPGEGRTLGVKPQEPPVDPPPPMPSTLTESFEDDLLFETPTNEYKRHSRTASDSSSVFSPNSTRTQPKVPQDPSSDPEIPAVLPAKSSDLTTFSQRSPGNLYSPRWFLHNQNQDPASGTRQISQNLGPNVEREQTGMPTPPREQSSVGNQDNRPDRSGVLLPGSASGKLPSKPNSIYSNSAEKHSVPVTEIQPNFKYPISLPKKADRALVDRDRGSGDQRGQVKNKFPSSSNSYANNIPSMQANGDRAGNKSNTHRVPSPAGSAPDESGEPVSANWFSTPADHDTHVARSVVKKGSEYRQQQNSFQSDRNSSNLRSNQNTSQYSSDDQTVVKEMEADLPEYLPIQRNSPKNKSVHSDSGLASDTTSTASRSSTAAAGKQTRNYFRQLGDFSDTGARPKYTSSNIPANTRNANSPLQTRQTAVASPVAKQILHSSSPVSGTSVSPVDGRSQNSNSPYSGRSGNTAVKTEKLQAGSIFSPIHPQPVTNSKVAKSANAISKDILHPTPIAQSVDTRRGSTRTNSSSASEGDSIDLRTQLVSAHEDQLATVTSLCKQEMKLLLGAKTGNKSFEDYMKKISEVLSQKMSAIQLLQDQIIAYQLSTQDNSM